MGSGLTKFSRKKSQKSSHGFNSRLISTIASYSPHLIISLLDDKPLVSPKSYLVNGACMLADICGFTKFSGELSQEGVSGIDKLRRITSSFLTKFIETVYYFYGDVIAFAGDALICYFGPIKEDLNDMTKCCLRAIHCGNELKTLQTNSLSAHIAIDYGPSSISFIGGYENHWAYVYEGNCFGSLDSCISDAKLQQLVISSAMFQFLENLDFSRELLRLIPLSSGNYLVRQRDAANLSMTRIGPGEEEDLGLQQLYDDMNVREMKNLMAEQLRKAVLKKFNPQLITFVPQPIQTNLPGFISTVSSKNNTPVATYPGSPQSLDIDIGNSDIGHKRVPGHGNGNHIGGTEAALNASSAELREVVCMFVKLDSYHPSREVFPFHQLQNFYHTFQQIIFTLGGFIRQIVMDDKGCVCIAMWGVPTASHINNSMRCLLATHHLTEYCDLNSIKISVGVTTGEVYCGRIGSPTRSDYAAVGPSINLSARLMAAAKGRIIFDSSTYYSLDKSITSQCFHQLPLMTLKGRSEPCQTYEFYSHQFSALPNPQQRPSVAGVALELQMMSQAWGKDSTGTAPSLLNMTVTGTGGGGGATGQHRVSVSQPFRFSTTMPSSPIDFHASFLQSPFTARGGGAVGGGGGGGYLSSPVGTSEEVSHESFLSQEVLGRLHDSLIQLSQWNSGEDGRTPAEVKLFYDEANFLDDDLVAMIEGKLSLPDSLEGNDGPESHLVQILYVLGIPGTGKTSVTTQLSSYCYTEDIPYIYIPLNDLHYQTEYGVLRILFKRLLGLENCSDLTKQQTLITNLFFEIFPPTHPLEYLVEKFRHLQLILGLSWIPVELTIKSRFSKLLKLHRLNNGRSTHVGGAGEVLDFSQKSQKENVSMKAKSSFFSLSRNLFSIGSMGSEGGDGDAADQPLSPPQNPQESYATESSDKFLTVLLLLTQSLKKMSPTAVIIDEFQHCDNLSWAIILYLITHLQAPLLFLFTITEPFSPHMRASQSRLFASLEDLVEEDLQGGGGGGSRFLRQMSSNSSATNSSSPSPHPFQSVYEPNMIEIQRKSKSSKHHFIRSISSLDPTSPQDKLLHKNVNKIKIFNYLYRISLHEKIIKIQLTGLKKRDVKLLLTNNLFNKELVTNTLVAIVSDLCEGNVHWCKAIIDFIIQFGEENFSETFCCYSQYQQATPCGGGGNESWISARSPPPVSAKEMNSPQDFGCGAAPTTGGEMLRSSISVPPKMTHNFPFVPTTPSNSGSHSPPQHQQRHPMHTADPASADLVTAFSDDSFPSSIPAAATPGTSSHLDPSSSRSGRVVPIDQQSFVGDVILYRLITTLMDSMKYLEKEVLKYASVLGIKFSSGLLYRLMAHEFESEDDFQEILSSLRKQNFVLEHFSKPSAGATGNRGATGASGMGDRDPLSSLNYSFLSHRMRDIVYNLIPWSDACRIHCLVAYHLEHIALLNGSSSDAPTLSSYSEILNFHYYIASTSTFFFTPEDRQTMTQLMNSSIEYLAEGSMVSLADPRPLLLRQNFFLFTDQQSSAASSSTRSQHSSSSRRSRRGSRQGLHIQSCCKTKSYQYSLLASSLYFHLHEYHKSFGYLKYAAEQEAISVLLQNDEKYYKEVQRLLNDWMRLCQQYQRDLAHRPLRGSAGGGSTGPGGSIAALLGRYIQVCCLLEECGMNK